MPATTPSRNSPATWWRRRRTCAAASMPCRPQAEGEPALVTKLREGFEGVERSFLGTLERNGIARKDAVGQPFDPELHQAMSEQPAPDGVAPGHRAAGLDAGLDAERPAAEAGDGRGRRWRRGIKLAGGAG